MSFTPPELFMHDVAAATRLIGLAKRIKKANTANRNNRIFTP
jgi:hypothetical protein